jgi:hypothetical protein
VSLDERPRGSTRPTPKVHHNSLPKTSIEGALGGTVFGTEEESSQGIAMRGDNAYVAGSISSADFPTSPGAFDRTFNGGFNDAFVTKLNGAGSALIYSTFLGGQVQNRASASRCETATPT